MNLWKTQKMHRLLCAITTIIFVVVWSTTTQADPQANLGVISYSFQNSVWQDASFGGSGNIISIHTDPSQAGVAYALSDVSGVFRTANFGEQWEQRSAGLGNYEVSSFAIDPFDAKTLYVGVGAFADSNKGGIYLSRDAGLTWSQLPSARDSGIHFRMYRTHDSIALDPSQQGVIVSGSKENGIWRSVDAGQSWQQVATPPQTDVPFYHPFGHTIPDDPTSEWRAAPVTTVEFDPTNANVVYAAWFGAGISKSDDGGQTWFNSGTGLPNQAIVHHITIGQHGTLYAALGLDGVYKSADSGATWQALNANIPNHEYRILSVATHPTDPNVAYFSQQHVANASNFYEAIWKTVDGGVTWFTTGSITYDTATNPTQTWGFYPLASWHVAVDPNQPETLYFVESGGLQQTTDGGDSWKTKVRGMQNTCVTELLVDPTDPNRLFSTHMDAGLLVSENDGTSWSMVMPTTIDQRDALGGHYYDVIAAEATDATAYFVVNAPWARNYNEVLRSWGGVVWESVLQIPDTSGRGIGQAYLAGHPAEPWRIYLAQDGEGISVSADFGDTWQTVPTQPPATKLNDITVDEAGRIFITSEWEGNWRSTDGGNSWEQILAKRFLGVDVIALHGAIYLAADDGNLYRSQDGGDSWTNLTNFTPMPDSDGIGSIGYGIGVNPHDSNHILFSLVDTWHFSDSGNGLFESRDGGATWTQRNNRLGTTRIGSVAFKPDGTTFVGSFCGGIWRSTPSSPVNLDAWIYLPIISDTGLRE